LRGKDFDDLTGGDGTDWMFLSTCKHVASELEFRAAGMNRCGLLFLEGGVGGVALGFEPEEEVEDLGGFEAVE
jgi:hypothetical protein